jgi:hypothetical protein
MAITQTSLNAIKTQVLNDIDTTYGYIAVGDDATAPVVGNTTLGNETDREALFEAASIITNTIRMYIFLDTTENNGNDINEAGLFDAASSGTMFARSLSNSITKDAFTEVTMEYAITVDALNA